MTAHFMRKIYSAGNIKIKPLTDFIHANVNDWGYTAIPVEIINTSGRIIPAIPRSKNPVILSISLFDEKGNKIFDDATTPLEFDISNKADCAVTIPILKQKGIYSASVDLITQGVRKWNIPVTRVKIIID